MLSPEKGNNEFDLPSQTAGAMLRPIHSKKFQFRDRLHHQIFFIEHQNISHTSLHTTFFWLQRLDLTDPCTCVVSYFVNLRRRFTINFQRQDQAVMRIQL